MTPQVERPAPRRIVAKASVDRLIADADRALSALEAEATLTRAAAEELEAKFGADGTDERGAAWLMVQLEQFVEQLRADAAREAADVVFEAEARARAMAEEARLAATRRHLEHGWDRPDAVASDELAVAPAPAPAPEPAIPDPLTTPTVPTAPTSDAAAPPAPDVASTATVGQPVRPASAPAGTQLDELFGLMAPDELAHFASLDGELAPVDDSFWPAEEPRKRRFRMSRPVALTQTLALGLLAAAAVVHFA